MRKRKPIQVNPEVKVKAIQEIAKQYAPIEDSVGESAGSVLRMFGINNIADLNRVMLEHANGASSPEEAAKRVTEKLMKAAIAKEEN